MIIMLFPLAVFVANQLKHVRAAIAKIFPPHRVSLFRELTSSTENASAIIEKKNCFSFYTRNSHFPIRISTKLDTHVVSVAIGSIFVVFKV